MVFGLEGHKGCKVAANIIHGFDCTNFILWLFLEFFTICCNVNFQDLSKECSVSTSKLPFKMSAQTWKI